MALSTDAEHILVLAQHLTSDDKLELAERLIADVRQSPPTTYHFDEAVEDTTVLVDVLAPNFDFALLPMTGIWSDNEEMKDPVAWVRRVRQREWGRDE